MGMGIGSLMTDKNALFVADAVRNLRDFDRCVYAMCCYEGDRACALLSMALHGHNTDHSH